MDIIKTYQNKINQIIEKYLENIDNQFLKEKTGVIKWWKKITVNDSSTIMFSHKINNESKNLLILIAEFLHSASLILDDLPSMDNMITFVEIN